MGIFQGFSEFLPISSSGHLAVLQYFFGIEEGNLFLTTMLHLGTLISIIIVYFNDIKLMIVEFLKLIYSTIKREKIKINKYQKYAIMIIISTIPTVIIALIFKDLVDSLFTNIRFISIAFIITGFLLWFASKRHREEKSIKEASILDAILIGLAQAIAIVPGISRSGSTIVASLLRGFKNEVATEYSFILAIPTILGAALLGFGDVVKGNVNILINGQLFVGVILSTIVGIISIKALVGILNKNKLHYFSYYLWAVGIIILFMSR